MDYHMQVSQLKDLSALEVHEIYKLRVGIFVHEQNTAYKEVDEIDVLPSTKHILVWSSQNKEELLGNIRVYEDAVEGQDVMRLGRVCVAESERGTGLAKNLMEYTINYADETFPEKNLVLDARTPLVRWYEKFGFRKIAEEYPFADITLTPMMKLH
ncbi:GNAT family N-acetyltransferase [Corynebacterium sp. H128]|uniref:GNAT family N-acetyltransferase n=1 Tax=unclassified Corynebacterium TaxID=2624378 RepID=UPI0030AE7D76